MNFKPLPYRDIIKKARKAGFVFRRNTGGIHEIWWNDEKKRASIIPHHKEIKPGTVKSITAQRGYALEEFNKL